jgi:hypothetical protein
MSEGIATVVIEHRVARGDRPWQDVDPQSLTHGRRWAASSELRSARAVGGLATGTQNRLLGRTQNQRGSATCKDASPCSRRGAAGCAGRTSSSTLPAAPGRSAGADASQLTRVAIVAGPGWPPNLLIGGGLHQRRRTAAARGTRLRDSGVDERDLGATFTHGSPTGRGRAALRGASTSARRFAPVRRLSVRPRGPITIGRCFIHASVPPWHRRGEAPSTLHRVGPWVPATPVDLVPALAGADTFGELPSVTAGHDARTTSPRQRDRP